MRKHPKSEDVRKVIDTFNTLPLQIIAHSKMLDMSNGRVTPIKTVVKNVPRTLKDRVLGRQRLVEEPCGTACCHGGWYVVASGIRQESFMVVAEKMAVDLGFGRVDGSSAHVALLEWANNESKIWGNPYGASMFSGNGEKAFIGPNRPQGARTIEDIIDHWEEVYARIVAWEKENLVEISEPPITAEELVSQLSPIKIGEDAKQEADAQA